MMRLILICIALISLTGCEEYLEQLRSISSGLSGLNGGIETNSTIEVKLEDSLQQDVDDIKSALLENIELTVAVDVPNSKVYVREVLLDGANPILLGCYVIDLASGTAYDPNFIEPYFQAQLRGTDLTNDEAVNCIKMMPVDV